MVQVIHIHYQLRPRHHRSFYLLTIATPTSGPRQETKQIHLLLQPTTETGQVICVPVVGSFDDGNHKGFDNPIHDIWVKHPVKLAALFPYADFICPYHKKCPRRTSQEKKSLCCAVSLLNGDQN
jgi:hypothetical protein